MQNKVQLRILSWIITIFMVLSIFNTNLIVYAIEDRENLDEHICEWDDGQIITEPTCIESGKIIYTCKDDICGATKIESIDSLGHTKEIVLPRIEPTCTEEGVSEGRVCEVCGEFTVKPEVLPVIAHKEVVLPGIEPTCTEEGRSEGKLCKVCGEFTVEPVALPVVPHVEIVLPRIEPTCTKEGMSEGSVCIICGEFTVEPEILSAMGHSGDWITVVDPTCTEEGEETRVCTCGETETRTVDALGHDYIGTETKEATCTETGEMTYICQNDVRHVYIKSIPMDKHIEEVIPSKAATCTDKGFTEGKKCSVCGTITIAPEEIPAIKHNYSEVEYTWSEDLSSVTAKRVCANDASHVEKEIVKTAYAETAATCTAKGEGKYTATFKNEVFEIQTKTIEIPMAQHVACETVKENEVGATCTLEGSYDSVVYCSECDEELSRETITIDKVAHTEEIIPAAKPTCTEEGMSEGIVCIICGEFIIEPEVLPLVPHEEVVIPRVEPTCTEEGMSEAKVCTVCGEFTVEPEMLPVVAHKEAPLPRVEATCIREGLTEGKYCLLCGDVIEEQEIIPILGHSFGEWEITTEPTCTEDGVETRVCHCGETETRPIDALDHDYEAVVTVATCTEAGFTTYTCKNDPTHTYISDQVEASGHVFDEYITTTKAELNKEGEQTATCMLCQTATDTKALSAIVKPEVVSKTYTGKSISVKIAIKDTTGKTIKTITMPKYKSVGTYSKTVNLTGDYAGSVKVSYKINPTGKSVSKLTAGKKSFTVKWSKASSKNRKQMTGYQIKYSTSSNMSKAKTVTVKSTTAKAKTIKKLKAKKTYYVQIRTYKIVKGVKHYSGWSKAKKVRTK